MKKIHPSAFILHPSKAAQAAQVFGHGAALPAGKHLRQGRGHILHVVGADAVC